MKLLLLSLCLLLGCTKEVPTKPCVCNIDYESLRDSMPLCQCGGIEIPACQISVHYCNVFRSFGQMSCKEVK